MGIIGCVVTSFGAPAQCRSGCTRASIGTASWREVSKSTLRWPTGRCRRTTTSVASLPRLVGAERQGRWAAHAALVVDSSTADGHSLAGCITGTRGIVLLHRGRFQEAQDLLLRAIE